MPKPNATTGARPGTSIRDVAAHAGVSTATVSRVLNGKLSATPETRQRVLAAIHELGYSQNQAARDLARGRSSLLGLIISDVRNPFFPDITAAFQDQALAHDMDALVLNTNYDSQRTLNSVKRVLALQVPGVAILTSQIDPSVIDMLASKYVAAVYLDLGRVDRGISNIVIDYEHGIAEALEYLLKLGHRKVAYIGGPVHMHSAQRRKRAFMESAEKSGLEASQIIDSDFSVKGGYFACSKLLNGQMPTAIVAGNDLTAIGVLHRAYDGGLRMPEDLSVVGFDDILFAEYTQPALTTVAVPRSEIGRVAFQALWKMIADPELAGREFRVATHLVARQSAVPPRGT
ncbi:MAG TPA: LacI family DNA-binding transcriptional regulator [Bryobacteraceae bacterium]|jgi:LacI family transcriptional regulator|nr:LacI family DNA-binding transcriptional regulator [Bryobacteraceae bacterium]